MIQEIFLSKLDQKNQKLVLLKDQQNKPLARLIKKKKDSNP